MMEIVKEACFRFWLLAGENVADFIDGSVVVI
jgi:hypothetical protein